MPLVDFSDIKQTDTCFFILRHDVEFSVEKAYDLATIEHEQLGIKSSYFFQLRNYTYNVFAYKNMAYIKKIHAMGHKIGLHVNLSGLANMNHIDTFIKNDAHILQSGLDLPIDRFSFHRPTHDLLRLNLRIDDLINAYDPMYFHFYHLTPPKALRVFYFSDSEHRWKYGNPLTILDKPTKKLQLLLHPYVWSNEGYDNEHTFNELIKEKHQWMLEAMHSECHNFPSYLLKTRKT